MKKLLALAILAALILFGRGTAHAIPILQLYIEGAFYDATSESWSWPHPDFPPDGPPRLWTIGNVGGPGGKGPISNVRLAVAYDAKFSGITIVLTPALIDDDGEFVADGLTFIDMAVPGTPTLLPDEDGKEERDGTDLPKLTGGNYLPNHGSYGPGVKWQEFSLGDFTEEGDSIADFTPPENYLENDYSGPIPFDITGVGEVFEDRGQINAYEIRVEDNGQSSHELSLHFDLYDTVGADNKAKAVFAPFSHDAVMAPEPASFIIWFLIGLTWAGRGWAYQYWHRWRRWAREDAAVADGMRIRPQAGRPTGSAEASEDRFHTEPAGRPATGRAERRPGR